MIHDIIRGTDNTPLIEYYENDNVIITAFCGKWEADVKFKPNADPKVKEIYKKLMEE
jgi:hypothetical protein